MFESFHIAYPYVLILGGIILAVCAWHRLFYYKPIVYQHSLVQYIANSGYGVISYHSQFFWLLRLVILTVLLVLTSRIQRKDQYTNSENFGIDIMLALDISGSMGAIDNPRDMRSRIEIAKDEAVRFVKKRDQDSIGMVVFAMEAFSRCPLTHDKDMILSCIHDITIGLLNHNETHLGIGLLTAANRLKGSQAKSKIIIVLTDGAPTVGDIEMQIPLDFIKALGVRVYTIGIGGRGRQRQTLQGILYEGVNEPLLEEIASRTGGAFFMADSASDMRAIYEKIDRLEKTKVEVKKYVRITDVYHTALAWVIALLLVELIACTLLWFVI